MLGSGLPLLGGIGVQCQRMNVLTQFTSQQRINQLMPFDGHFVLKCLADNYHFEVGFSARWCVVQMALIRNCDKVILQRFVQFPEDTLSHSHISPL